MKFSMKNGISRDNDKKMIKLQLAVKKDNKWRTNFFKQLIKI